MNLLKKKTISDKSYLEYLRKQPCVFTGTSEVEPSHMRVGAHAGMGQKPDDWMCFPVYYHIHRRIHQHGELSTYLEQVNEHPMVLASFMRDAAKLRYMKWLSEMDREGEILGVIYA